MNDFLFWKYQQESLNFSFLFYTLDYHMLTMCSHLSFNIQSDYIEKAAVLFIEFSWMLMDLLTEQPLLNKY